MNGKMPGYSLPAVLWTLSVDRRAEEVKLFYVCAEKRRSTVLLHPPMCTAFYWDWPDEEVNLSGACVKRRNDPVVRSSPGARPEKDELFVVFWFSV